MVKLIYGSDTSAKSRSLISDIAKDESEGKRSFLIVPEQFAVQTERITLKELDPSAQLTLEVLNFSRLYNRICREYGGLRYNYITKPLRYALMWQSLHELMPHLEIYSKAIGENTASLCEMMISVANELKLNKVTPLALERAARKIGSKSNSNSDSVLSKKLCELSSICSTFENTVSYSFSDSADDISRLCEVLDEHPFFKDCNVYIDHFSSFTAAEYDAIEKMIDQADNVSITLPLAYPKMDEPYTATMLDAEKIIRKICENRAEIEDIIIETDDSLKNPNIKKLASSLWKPVNMPEDSNSTDTDGVSLIKCDSPYSEAEAAAAISLSLMRDGYRCRDIVVIARDAEQYRGIFEPAFEKCGVPYYFSEKTDLCKTPIVKFILSALRITIYGWQTNDVISHLKCALYNIDTASLDRFEQYVSTWQIKGSRFYDGDFLMNPDGYTEDITERGKKILDDANKVRRFLCDALLPLFEELEAEEDIASKCRALYRFLTRAGIDKRLEELAQKETERRNEREAKEYSRLFSLCCDALGELAEALSDNGLDSSVSTKEFCELLTLYFSKTQMGTIPTSVDQIIIGSASVMRSDAPKCAIILGLCEGVFPAPVNDSSLLSFEEKELIGESIGVKFSSTQDSVASDELMYVQRAIEAPSDKLYLLTHTASADGRKCVPSLPFERAEKLFKIKAKAYDCRNILDITPSLNASLPYLSDIFTTPEGEALRSIATRDEEIEQLLQKTSIPISDIDCKVEKETARRVFGNEMKLTQSKIDKFVGCKFSYYCSYVLKLREEQISRFKANDIGTFIHYILEMLLCAIVTKEGVDLSITPEEIEKLTKETVDEYITRINPHSLTVSARLGHLYKRLYSLSLLLVSNIIDEFRHSSFRPEFFELDTNGKDSNPSAREFVLKDGTKIIFSGIIDRVDILRLDDRKVYIRVVDYKTGTKQFSLDDVKQGFNIQMLLYLFTLINNKNNAFNEKLGSDTPLPAGVVYLSSNAPPAALYDIEGSDSAFSKAQQNLTRSGLFLDDKDILYAMNDEFSPHFLAGIKIRKKDGLPTGKALAKAELFDMLSEELDNTVRRIGEEMIEGLADAIPNNYDKKNPCEYCAMKPICRREKF